MKRLKRCLAMVLCFVMLVGMVPMHASASTGNKTRADAVSWAQTRASAREELDYDGVSGAQCVDLIKYYYVYLGNSAVRGNGKDYATNSLPAGWTRIQYYSGFVPQPGDIAVWTTGGGGYGHVAIVVSGDSSKMTVVEQNWVGKYCSSRSGVSTSGIWGVIRPDFSGGSSSPSTSYVDVGTDFYAYIINTSQWRLLTNDVNNVSLRSETGDSNQIWYFERQSDKSYKITSLYNGYSLDVDMAGTSDGTNVKVDPYTGHAAQQWYVTGEPGKYIFHAKCTNAVMDVEHGSYAEGANIQMWSYHGTDSQHFTIWTLSDKQPSEAGITSDKDAVLVDTGKITFSFGAINATHYAIGIDRVGTGRVQTHNLTSRQFTTSFSQSGIYTAYVTCWNSTGGIDSSKITFTVYNDIGTDFTAVILNKNSWKPIENSYSEGEKPPVRIADENGHANQLWRFERQSDGSYKIASCYDGKYLDVRDASTEINTVIQTCIDTGSDAQKWYIYEESGGYILKSKLSKYVIDLNNNDTTTGNYLKTYDWNGTDAQIWAIYRRKVEAPQLTVNAGTSVSKTVFNWNSVYGARDYTLKIWENEAWKGNEYLIEYDAKSGIGVNLPAGTYKAYIDACHEFDYEMSNVVTFTVEEGSYTITYNANGGTGAPESQTKAYGEELTLSSTVPTRTGYTFLGWATSSDATSAEYEAGASFKENANTTLYAVWKADEYTVTYDANGGTGAPENQVKIHDAELTLSKIVPTRTNYTFLGWATSSNATSAEYEAGASFTANANITLYAVWDKNEYIITYDGAGCTYLGGLLDITAAGTYTIENIDKENAHGDRIVVSAPSGVVNIILDGVLVDTSGTTDAPFDITGDCTVNIILADGSYNSFEAGLDRAAIENNSHPITISCEHATEEAHFCNKTCGDLCVVGQGRGAGIGGADGENGENITIQGGDITASTVSGNGSTGIGGGFGGNASNINICGGVVNAASIGAGFGGSAESIFVRPQTGMKIKVTADNIELEGSPFTVDENITELISGSANVVLREYSALSVIKNADTGDYYESIDEAIKDAENGETVQLIEDCSVHLLVIPNGITLDLNGYMLTIAGRMFGSYGNVIDRTVGGEGGLVIAQNDIAILQPDNKFLPIYDTTNGCYRFFEYEMRARGAVAANGNGRSVKYGYTLYFYNTKAYELLANNAETNLGMTVQLSWTGMSNPLSYTVPTATLASFAKTAGNQLATKGKVTAALTFTVNGLENLGSDAVVFSSATITSTTSVAMSSEVTEYEV